MMAAILKQDAMTALFSDMLKISVGTRANWLAYSLRAHPGMFSGSNASFMFPFSQGLPDMSCFKTKRLHIRVCRQVLQVLLSTLNFPKCLFRLIKKDYTVLTG